MKSNNAIITNNNIIVDFQEINYDFQLPEIILTLDLNLINLDTDDSKDTDCYLKIISSMPVKVPHWLKDSLLWITQDDEKRVNIIFEREETTLAAAKRLAENDIKSQIDKNLKKLFESEIFEFYEKFKIENSELLKYIKFEFNNFNFIINQYTKDNYWQYLVLYDNGQTRYFYRYYIYLSISYSNYIELRNAFIQKIYNQKSNERDVLDLLIEFLKEKV